MEAPVPLSSLLGRRGVVLLGDPGLGKTLSLRCAAVASGTKLQTVRAFLANGAIPHPDRPLFLDGLDEAMTAYGTTTPLDTVTHRLSSMGFPPFWISCRPSDWVRAGGRALLEELLAEGLTVAGLLPLPMEQVRAAIAARGLDPDVVVQHLDEAGLVSLLGNPETLRLTIEVFQADGAPRSRTDLYRQATSYMARETNAGHARHGARPSEEQVLAAAGAICATCLLSGRPDIVASGPDTEAAVSLQTVAVLAGEDQARIALGSRLFRQSGDESWGPAHRTTAEFLGASFLADQVSRHGQPLGRTISLLCGSEPSPEPSLRGLFAWVVALLPDRAAEIVHRDPYGVLTYGDPAALRPIGRRALMAGLKALAETEPFFRAGHWGEGRFSALATPELVPELREILLARPVRVHLLSCVLDALEEGEARPEVDAELTALILDAEVDIQVRGQAVAALVRAAPAPALLFRQLLHDDVADPRCELAGHLLLRLYPAALDDDAAVTFFDRFLSTDDGEGASSSIDYSFPRLVPPGREVQLLDRFAARGWSLQRRHPNTRHLDVQRIAIDLAVRALDDVERTDAARVATWLPLFVDAGLAGDDGAFKAALKKRPDLYAPLLQAVWRSRDEEADPAPWVAPILLRHALPWLDPPDDGVDRLLDAVAAEPDAGCSVVLYASALRLLPDMPSVGDAVFERAWTLGELRPELLQRRAEWSACDLKSQDWRAKERERRRARAREASARNAADIALLDEHLDAVRAGTHVDALAWLAGHWFDDFSQRKNGAADPEERLLLQVPRRIVDAAKAGFSNYALSAPAVPPAALASRAVGGTQGKDELVVLAGTDLIFRAAGRLDGMSVDRCTAVLCLGLARLTHTVSGSTMETDKRPWLGYIAATFPQESERAVREFLVPQVEREVGFTVGLAELRRQDGFDQVRRSLVPELIGVASPSGPAFDMLRSMAGECDRTRVEAVVRARLDAAAPSPLAARWPWLFLAWRLSPAEYHREMREALEADEGLFLDEVLADFGNSEPFSTDLAWAPLALPHREAVVRLVGPRFPPVPVPSGTWSPPTPFDYHRLVQGQIDAIGDTAGSEAEQALRSLLAEPTLASYRDHILHALSGQRRNARLARRETPALGRLVQSLRGGPPATTAELHAFAMAHLVGMAEALRKTDDNAWMAFWNVQATKKGRVTEARPENDCRDAVYRSLNARFERAGISQEAEARFVGDTRCDIKVAGVAGVVPVEVKCDWHERLWTAWKDQLQEQYAVDPRTGGFGIYLAIWFGEKRGGSRRVRPPPSGSTPSSALELQLALDGFVAGSADRLAAIVVDASPL